MKICILGSTHFHNSLVLHETLCELARTNKIDRRATLVTSMDKGCSTLAYNLWAGSYKLPVEQYPVCETLFGRLAVLHNTARMIKLSNLLLVVWGEGSYRLRHAIWFAKQDKVPFIVIDQEGKDITEEFT